MRVLTVRQPWADCIVFHGKTVENRTRNIAGDYRGPVAILAGQGFDADACVSLRAAVDLRPREDLVRGAIIGVVDLVDVHHQDGCLHLHGACSSWADFSAHEDLHHLVLANPRPLTTPIRYRGALGLRRLDDRTTALILADLDKAVRAGVAS